MNLPTPAHSMFCYFGFYYDYSEINLMAISLWLMSAPNGSIHIETIVKKKIITIANPKPLSTIY